LIKAGGRTIRYEIHKIITSLWNKEELPEEWKELIIVPIYKKGDKTDSVSIEEYHFYQLVQNFIQHLALKINCIYRENYWGSSMWILTQKVNC